MRLAPSRETPTATQRALRRLLREEDAWLLRQIGSLRPVLWLRPQPLGAAARHGIIALRIGADGLVRGAVKADANALPWPDDSIPAVVLQHACEGSDWSAAVLAEASRVLEPEGRLYVLRFDRFSPWFWRYGRQVLKRSAARWLSRPPSLRLALERGLALEYRHRIGARGLRDAGVIRPKVQRPPDHWPFAGALRASRAWVLCKRRQQFLVAGIRPTAHAPRPSYGLATARRERGDSDA